MNDIYTRLVNGESADAIAKEFTTALNEAEARIQEEARVKAEAEAKAKEARDANREAAKVACRALVKDFGKWIIRYFPAIGLTEEDLDDESIDVLVNLMMMTMDMEGMKISVAGSKNKPTVKVNETAKPATVDPFASFFKSFGL